MVGPIASALALGYTNSQIIQYLVRTFPAYAPQINKALKYGFTPDRIIKYLLKGREGVNQPEVQETEHELTRKADKQNEKKLEKIIGGTGLAAAGIGVGLGLGGQAAIQGIQGLMGGSVPNNPPPPPVAPQAGTLPINPTVPINQQTIANPGGNQLPASPVSPQSQLQSQQLQQTQQTPLASPPQPPQVSFQQLFQDFPEIRSKIDNLVQSGNNDASTIEAYFKKFGNSTVNKIQNKYGKSFIEFIQEYLSTIPQQQIKTNQSTIPANTQLEKPNETPALEEKKVAILPNGDIGNIKSIKGKVVKLDVDGKQKIMNLSKIIQSPLPEKHLGDLYDQLMENTPEEDKSAAIFWAGYDDKANKLQYIPHGGALYTYENIPEEFADKLKNSMFKAKTTGKTTEGMWFAGGASRGAGLYQLIQDLQKQYGGKGKEYSGKAEPIFDAFRSAREASRAKKKKVSDEKKEKRKRRNGKDFA